MKLFVNSEKNYERISVRNANKTGRALQTPYALTNTDYGRAIFPKQLGVHFDEKVTTLRQQSVKVLSTTISYCIQLVW